MAGPVCERGTDLVRIDECRCGAVTGHSDRTKWRVRLYLKAGSNRGGTPGDHRDYVSGKDRRAQGAGCGRDGGNRRSTAVDARRSRKRQNSMKKEEGKMQK